ncbi:MAG: site-2 protease family protein [Fusobacteriaceae bacterium]
MKKFFQEILHVNKHMNNGTKIILGLLAFYAFYSIFNSYNFTLGTFIKIILFLIAIIFHEVAHGMVAFLCGDPTAKNKGRLTLNPISHIDPLGLLLPLMLIFSGSSFIIGWAKPVPVNYNNFKNGRWGEFFVSSAGIFTNFILAFLTALFIKFFFNDIIELNIFPYFAYFISINLILGIFNLLPVPPLDGSKIIASFLNEDSRYWIFSLEKYGIFIILALSYLGLLNVFISPLYKFSVNFLDWFISL